MKISSSSSLLFATLAISSSSSSLAVPVGDASPADGVSNSHDGQHSAGSRRMSTSIRAVEAEMADTQSLTHDKRESPLCSLLSDIPILGSILGPVVDPILDPILGPIVGGCSASPSTGQNLDFEQRSALRDVFFQAADVLSSQLANNATSTMPADSASTVIPARRETQDDTSTVTSSSTASGTESTATKQQLPQNPVISAPLSAPSVPPNTPVSDHAPRGIPDVSPPVTPSPPLPVTVTSLPTPTGSLPMSPANVTSPSLPASSPPVAVRADPGIDIEDLELVNYCKAVVAEAGSDKTKLTSTTWPAPL